MKGTRTVSSVEIRNSLPELPPHRGGSTFGPGIGFLLILVAAKVLFHTLTNNQYGFHRDELATLDDARRLAWGYVAYPPVTPFFGRISLELFGTSLRGFRFFAVLAGAAAVLLTGLTARELGGKRFAQSVAALAVACAPLSLASSRVFQYVAFDYLWWVLLAYFVVRLLNSNDPRWWVAIGAAIGVGMLTKYTMIFFVAGVVSVFCSREPGVNFAVPGYGAASEFRWLYFCRT